MFAPDWTDKIIAHQRLLIKYGPHIVFKDNLYLGDEALALAKGLHLLLSRGLHFSATCVIERDYIKRVHINCI